jgi:glycosyltransferase involved in cell wall biosynthesis
MSKLKVVISGIFYPVTMMEYFIRAFERRDDIELKTAGSFSGAYIPWNGGMYINQKYVRTPDICLPYPPQPIDPAWVEKKLPWKPDLWIQIDAGWHFSRRPEGMRSIGIGTDPHVLNYDALRSMSDIFFNMQLVYKQSSDVYLPYAYDPTLHKHLKVEKEYDTCLIGLQYEQRINLINALRNEHISVNQSIGKVYEEFVLEYNKSKVALNWSSLDDLNARTFEAMGMGIPLVTNRVTDLSNFFVEGEHYLGFNDISEAVRQVHTLLRNPELAEQIARAGHRKAKAGHTYDIRVSQIIERCGFGKL